MNNERDMLIQILRGGLLNTWPTPEQVAVPSMPKGFENWYWTKLYNSTHWFLKNGEESITYGQVFPPVVTGFIKGQVYRVEIDQYMLNDRAEYHSSFPRKGDGVLLHNFIGRYRDNDLGFWLLEDHQVFEAIAGGVI